jgi:hypothetical protein
VAADAERRFFEKRREKQKRRGKNGKKKMTDAGSWAVNIRSLGEKSWTGKNSPLHTF